MTVFKLRVVLTALAVIIVIVVFALVRNSSPADGENVAGEDPKPGEAIHGKQVKPLRP